jgi:hypothetical protein
MRTYLHIEFLDGIMLLGELGIPNLADTTTTPIKIALCVLGPMFIIDRVYGTYLLNFRHP